MEDTDYRELALSHGLARVGSRPPLLEYIRETWTRRSFALTLARYRIEAANQQNRLGLAWVVIRPLLNALVYGVIFGVVLQQQRSVGEVNYIPFLIVGVFIFEYFSDAFSDGAKAITSNDALVKSLSFPRILLPISTVLQAIYELVPMVLVMFVIVLISGEPITWAWFMVIPILLLMTLFNAGVAFIAARITVHFRDFRQIVPFITRLFFYSTGVFFALDAYLSKYPELLFVARLNPVHDFIALVRGSLIEHAEIVPLYWIVAAIASVVFFVGGFIYFWRAEEQYGRD